MGLCLNLWLFNFWRNVRRDVSLKIKNWTECHNRLPQPGRKIKSESLIPRAHSLEQTLCRQGGECRPANDPPLTEGMLIVGEPQSNKCNCFCHVWLTGLELNISALSVLMLILLCTPAVYHHTTTKDMTLKESVFKPHRGLRFITFFKNRRLMCCVFFLHLRTARPPQKSVKSRDESISLPKNGDTLSSEEKQNGIYYLIDNMLWNSVEKRKAGNLLRHW